MAKRRRGTKGGYSTLETQGRGLDSIKAVSAIKYGNFSFRKGRNAVRT